MNRILLAIILWFNLIIARIQRLLTRGGDSDSDIYVPINITTDDGSEFDLTVTADEYMDILSGDGQIFSIRAILQKNSITDIVPDDQYFEVTAY